MKKNISNNYFIKDGEHISRFKFLFHNDFSYQYHLDIMKNSLIKHGSNKKRAKLINVGSKYDLLILD